MDNIKTGGMLLGTEIIKAIDNGDIIITGNPKPLTVNPNSINLTLNKFLKVYKIVRPLLSDIDYKIRSELSRGMEEYINLTGKYNDESTSFSGAKLPYLDMHEKPKMINLAIPEDGLVLYPGILYIGSTNERTVVNGLVPTINGRSSTGRLGLCVHITAGFGDNGFAGTWTLEITVAEPLKVYYDEEICQISFSTVVGDKNNELNIYRGRYYNQEGPTESRMYLGKL